MDSVNESSPAASIEDIVQAKVEHLPFQDEETAVEEASQEEGEVIGYFELDPSTGLQLMQGENTIYLPPEALGEHVLMSEAGKGCQQIIVVVEEGSEGDVTGLAPGTASETTFSEECHTVLSEDAFEVQDQVSQEAEGSMPKGHQQVLILSDGSADIQGVHDGVVAVAEEGDCSPAEGNVVIYTESPCIVPEFGSAAQSEMTTVLKSPGLLQLEEQSGCTVVDVAEVEEATPIVEAKHESHRDSVLHPFPGEPVAELASDTQAEVPQSDSVQDEPAESFEEIKEPSTAGSVSSRDTSQDTPNATTCMQQHISMDVAAAVVPEEEVSGTRNLCCVATTDVRGIGHEIPDRIEKNEHIGGIAAHRCVADKAGEDVSDAVHHEEEELQDQCSAETELLQRETVSRSGDEEAIPCTVRFPTPAPIGGEAEHGFSILAGVTELQSGLTSHPAALGTSLRSALGSHTTEEEVEPSDLRHPDCNCDSPLTSATLEDYCVTGVQPQNSKHSNQAEDELLSAPTGNSAPILSESFPEAVRGSEQATAEMRHYIQQSSSACKWEESQHLSQAAVHEPKKTDEKTGDPKANRLNQLVCTNENENGIFPYNCRTLKELAEGALKRHGAPHQAEDDYGGSPGRASNEPPHFRSDRTENLFETGSDNFQPLLRAEIASHSRNVPHEPLLEAQVTDVMEKESIAESPLHIRGTNDVAELSTIHAAGSETVFVEPVGVKSACAIPLADVEQACKERAIPGILYREASTDQPGSLSCGSEHVPCGNADSAKNESEHSKNVHPPLVTGNKIVEDCNQNCNGATSVEVKGKEVNTTESTEALSSDLHLNIENSAVASQDADKTPITENSGGPETDIADILLSSEVDEQAERGPDGLYVEQSVGKELMAALELVPCQESSVIPPINSQGVEDNLVEPVPKKEKKRKKKLEDLPKEDTEDLPSGKKRWCLRTPTKPRKRLIIPDSDEDDFDTYESFDIPQETQKCKSEDAFDALLSIFKIEQAKKAAETAPTKSRKVRKAAADTTRSRGANTEEAKGRRSICYKKKTVEQPQGKLSEISLAPGNDTAQGSLSEIIAISSPVSKPERKHKGGLRKPAAPRKRHETVADLPSTRNMLAGDIHIRCQRPATSPEKSVPQYHCSKCGFRSARMDNIVRHHKEDCPHTKNFFKWDHEMLKRVTGLDSGYHPS